MEGPTRVPDGDQPDRPDPVRLGRGQESDDGTREPGGDPDDRAIPDPAVLFAYRRADDDPARRLRTRQRDRHRPRVVLLERGRGDR